MKAWPIDPLALRDLKLEVSEKLPIVAALKPGVRPWLVGITLYGLGGNVRQCTQIAGIP